jgi:hypothetical protein
MYFGYLTLSSYTFLAIGFCIVMAVGTALGLVYFVGASRGRRAAELWVRAWLAVLAVGAIADIGFAVASRQWAGFLMQYGLGPLFEMLTLAALFLGSMWFMALRYTQGLEK